MELSTKIDRVLKLHLQSLVKCKEQQPFDNDNQALAIINPF